LTKNATKKNFILSKFFDSIYEKINNNTCYWALSEATEVLHLGTPLLPHENMFDKLTMSINDMFTSHRQTPNFLFIALNTKKSSSLLNHNISGAHSIKY
jgi:cobalamin biosynthesis Co2+ chelatase CbiK